MKPALVISNADNVATALENLEPGTAIDLLGIAVRVREPIPRGHKLARLAIRAGEAIVKYGSPIGRATADIAAGDYVHTHNVASDRGRGDLSGSVNPAAPPAARLAEPDEGGDPDPDRVIRPVTGRRSA